MASCHNSKRKLKPPLQGEHPNHSLLFPLAHIVYSASPTHEAWLAGPIKTSEETEPLSAHSRPPQTTCSPCSALWKRSTQPLGAFLRLHSTLSPVALDHTSQVLSLLIKQLRSSLLPCPPFPFPRFSPPSTCWVTSFFVVSWRKIGVFGCTYIVIINNDRDPSGDHCLVASLLSITSTSNQPESPSTHIKSNSTIDSFSLFSS